MKNYYEILNVPFDADLKLIKKSYRQLALKYHPDKNKSSDSHERFVVIVEAYEVLSNELARKEIYYIPSIISINRNYPKKELQITKRGRHKAQKREKNMREKSIKSLMKY